jgi:serine/alanine adding enzyme
VTTQTLRIEPFVGGAADWDAFGVQQAGWTAYHRYAWRAIIESVHHRECAYLAARDAEGRLRGILPLVVLRSPVFGRSVVSMPYLNYGGPLGDAEAIQALAVEAQARARKVQARNFELRSAVPLPLPWTPSHRKLTVVLPLTGGADAIFKRFKPKLRSQIRRPTKDGVTVEFGRDQVEPFHRVYARHMRDLGTPAQPLAFFEAIAHALADDVWFACSWYRGLPIAAAAGFRWHDEFELAWASALRSHSRLSANMGLYWAFIERAAAEGVLRWNFGRCTPGSATHTFKRQWGGEDEPLWWYSGEDTQAPPSADSPKFRVAVQLWQRLPLAVAGVLGPRIVRDIP